MYQKPRQLTSRKPADTAKRRTTTEQGTVLRNVSGNLMGPHKTEGRQCKEGSPVQI